MNFRSAFGIALFDRKGCVSTEYTLTGIFQEIKRIFADDYSGHDFFHTERVYKNAMNIAENEHCEKNIVALAALLHDVDDPKLFSTENFYNARQIMRNFDIPQNTTDRVIEIIGEVSFKGVDTVVPKTIEGKIVQDADRLDALGAIGIARAFAYGGSRNREMYNPDIVPEICMDGAAYLSHNGTTVNHFYEKLLLLKDMMNTECAREIAEKRTKVMEDFLVEFLSEWSGECGLFV